LFTPNGVSRNPTITLYRGQTYTFDIKTIGHPFSIKTTRTSGTLDRYTNGVDGVALNIKLEKSVVQVKYRSNTASLLSSNKDHLANMFSDGMLTHEVTPSKEPKDYRHFVFTTAKGLHYYTDQEMFKGKVKCFGFDEISTLVDNNLPFWYKASQLLKQDT
jgi:hypothetical protein